MTKRGTRTKLGKFTRILLAPISITLFLAGWILFNIGQSKSAKESKYEKKQRPTNNPEQAREDIIIGVLPKDEIPVTA